MKQKLNVNSTFPCSFLSKEPGGNEARNETNSEMHLNEQHSEGT